ncbi:MAG: septum formation protein Maf [Chlamydiae bacterium]|nr:septum formation protein Maf [Chlamydiota bacterium]
MQKTLILASNSKRRRQILEKIRLRHRVIPSFFDEDQIPLSHGVENYSLEVALAKGRLIAEKHPKDWVLSADTSVYFKEQHLNKPRSLGEAEQMLFSLQGQDHIVTSAMALFHQNRVFSIAHFNRVFFKSLNSDWIRYYHSTIDVLDAAGSYMIDGLSSLFIEKIEGTQESVMGLPVHLLEDLIKKHGGQLCDFSDYSLQSP